MPIWSDHPGHFVQNSSNTNGLLSSSQSVGQKDLLDAGRWVNLPHRFSYYEYESAQMRVSDDTRGVISYGTLYKSGSGHSATWRPGFWIHHHGVNYRDNSVGEFKSRFCTFKDAVGSVWDTNNIYDVQSTDCYYCTTNIDQTPNDTVTSNPGWYESGVTCTATSGLLGAGAGYLAATRSGFKDYRIRWAASSSPESGGEARSKILPTNFDIQQFELAMQDTTQGELGSYFNAGANFNGVVWITNSWPGQLNNLGANGNNTFAGLWPNQGQDQNVKDDYQAKFYTNHDSDHGDHFNENDAQTALPFALCSNDPDPVLNPAHSRWGYSRPIDGSITSPGFDPYFTIPSCSSAAGHRLGHPNAIRFINGRNIDRNVFQTGLTLSSNIPVYILGDLNRQYQTSSVSDCRDYPAASASSCDESKWLPMQVAADAVMLLSNSWSDENSRWNNTFTDNYAGRIAGETEYWFAQIGGETPSSSSHSGGGISNFPRFLEKWSGVSCFIEGAMVLGFKSVYARQSFSRPSEHQAYGAPARKWGYDKHFNQLANQPPGSPTFTVNAVKTWRRDSDY